MSQRLHPLPIPELRGHREGLCWSIDQPVGGLDSLTPVRGQLWALHHGTALELRCRVETILTLRCDRCLQHYNHPLHLQQRELLEIDTPAAADGLALEPLAAEPGAAGAEGAELGPEERLDPRGSFDPERWLFEQLSLQLPLVNRCGRDCPGPAS